MKYFYSGASKTNAEQTDANLSLGGHISSSPLPNDLLQNIFLEATYLSVQQKKRETKMIILKNDSSQIADSLVLGSALNNSSIGKYKVAFVLPDSNGCFEKLSNSSALPFHATFEDMGNNGLFNLPNLGSGEYLGIWLSREYDFDSDDLKDHDKAYWLAQLDNPTTPDTQDSLTLTLNYNLI